MTDTLPSFGLICVGNEILSGKVQESNLAFWIQEFKKLGRTVRMAMIVPDDRDLIVSSIRQVRAASDIVLICGGIGPTHDDFTLPCIAEALGRKLVRNHDLVQAIKTHYKGQVTDFLLTMADLPEGTELLFWDQLLVPLFHVDNVYIFPGAPTLLRAKFKLLARQFRSQPLVVHKIYTNFDEGRIAQQISQLETDFPGLQVGSYPRYDVGAEYSVMITLEHRQEQVVTAALEQLKSEDFQAGVLREERHSYGL